MVKGFNSNERTFLIHKKNLLIVDGGKGWSFLDQARSTDGNFSARDRHGEGANPAGSVTAGMGWDGNMG